LRSGAARSLLAACAAAAALACGGRSDASDPAELPTAEIRVGNDVLTVEVAATPGQRGRGLMFREKLPDDRGMLFIFPDDRVLEFWMRNTSIPLSIAFADASGQIVRIADLEPFLEMPVSSGALARYALEVNRGWFDKRGIQSGDAIRGIPSLHVQ
jgi:uncharacterized membrane protein (UPF0127 family)